MQAYEKLRRARLALNIEQRALAKKAGVPANYLCMFERGQWKLSAERVAAIEAALRAELLAMARRAERYAENLVH